MHSFWSCNPLTAITITHIELVVSNTNQILDFSFQKNSQIGRLCLSFTRPSGSTAKMSKQQVDEKKGQTNRQMDRQVDKKGTNRQMDRQVDEQKRGKQTNGQTGGQTKKGQTDKRTIPQEMQCIKPFKSNKKWKSSRCTDIQVDQQTFGMT